MSNNLNESEFNGVEGTLQIFDPTKLDHHMLGVDDIA